MTAKILKSRLQGVSEQDFALVVKIHADNLKAWHAPGHDPYPAPWSLPVVEEAIRRPDLIPDYEIIDDVSPTLRQVKDMAIARVLEVEQQVLTEIYPPPLPGKQRLLGLEGRDGPTEDQQKKMAEVWRNAGAVMSAIEDWTSIPDAQWEQGLSDRLRGGSNVK